MTMNAYTEDELVDKLLERASGLLESYIRRKVDERFESIIRQLSHEIDLSVTNMSKTAVRHEVRAQFNKLKRKELKGLIDAHEVVLSVRKKNDQAEA